MQTVGYAGSHLGRGAAMTRADGQARTDSARRRMRKRANDDLPIDDNFFSVAKLSSWD